MPKPVSSEFSEFDFHDSCSDDASSRSTFLNRSGIAGIVESTGRGGNNNGGTGSNGVREGLNAERDIDGGDDGDGDGDGDDDDGDGEGSAMGTDNGSNGICDGSSQPPSEAGDGGSSAAINSTLNSGGLSGNCSMPGGGIGGCTNSSINSESESNRGGGGNGNNSKDNKKYRHQNYSKNIYIGTKNAERWDITRARLSFKNDVEFVAYLLKLADNDTERGSSLPSISSSVKNFANFKMEPNLSAKDFSNSQTENSDYIAPIKPVKQKKRVQFHDSLNGFIKSKEFTDFTQRAKKHDSQDKAITSGLLNDEHIPEVLDCRIAEKIKNELQEKSAKNNFKSALCLKKPQEYKMFNRSDDDDDDDEDEDHENDEKDENESEVNPLNRKFRIRDRAADSTRKRTKKRRRQSPINGRLKDGSSNHMDRDNELGGGVKCEEDDDDDDLDSLKFDTAAVVNQSCCQCSVSHDYEQCPIRNAQRYISDTIDLSVWEGGRDLESLSKLKNQLKSDENDNGDDSDQSSDNENKTIEQMMTFAEASLPPEFELRNLEPNSIGIFTKAAIPQFTKFGPLIGQPYQVGEISDDCNMRMIFEICVGGKSIFISTANPNSSNWLRYMRPASRYEDRNTNLVSIENQAFFVTCIDIRAGCELLYWSDACNTLWRKKHTEKTNCGGCNIKFDHPLHYRTHCSAFHDPSMSLTIRKYHCKICGETIIGKDNLLKHAAEMHDGKDMAEVLRDFQCKLCSKLLGSRAALQRHSKEVHSRNSAVVSCPRCQKLFQNRSNLKIHMLTHSGVRPFKCAEGECTAAFTTKQCLQFHYKKVHNYTQEQMPKIERSVAYTFDAYSGGMKADFLEQAPRRRRKSLEDQNSLMSSSILDSKSDSEFSDENIFESIKKSGKSIKDLCRNETNLSLLSTKITSLFGKEANNRKRKRKQRPSSTKPHIDDDDNSEDRLEHVRRKQNAQLSLVETFLTTTAQRLSAQQSVLPSASITPGNPSSTVMEDVIAAHKMAHPSSIQNEPLMANDDNDNNYRHHRSPHSKDSMNTISASQNLVVSKGSKKWISDDDRHLPRDCPSADDVNDSGVGMNDPNKLIPNRDFLARFMMNNANDHTNHNQNSHEEDENSSFLDVVDSNNQAGQMAQFHHGVDNNEAGGTSSGIIPDNQSQLHMSPHHQSFISSFYNNSNARLTTGNAVSTSASMLVEAALNSVGNIMETEGNNLKAANNSNLDGENNLGSQLESNRFSGNLNNMDNIEHEIKMMKSLNNFPMQIPPLPMYQNATNNLSSCNISPNTQTPTNQSNSQNNDIDVDADSTPRGQRIGGRDSDGFSSHHHTPPSPQVVISPGRDYSMFGSSGNGTNGSNNISASSPLPMPSRRSAPYPEHELISPASSPAIPRYNFSSELCRKRDHENERAQSISAQNHLSSDEENSIIAQNNTNSGQDMRMKFTQSQMDLMYSKYESMANAANLKYNNSQDLDVADFRNNTSNDLSDLQGLDMTSRGGNVGSNYHHNYQLPSGGANLSGLGRYHHHIYDILSEREQQQQQQQQHQQQHNQQQDHGSQLSMQSHQSLHNMMPDQIGDPDHDQTTSVDLSRTANFSSPPPIPYSHPHHDMLRMHNSRDSLDHHRLLSTAEQHRILAASNADQHRLLVDPTAHLLMEQNNRLLGSDQSRLLGESAQNRHMARGFGAYHQVSSGNYHPSVRPVLPSSNHHTPNPSNYHPFPAYY